MYTRNILMVFAGKLEGKIKRKATSQNTSSRTTKQRYPVDHAKKDEH